LGAGGRLSQNRVLRYGVFQPEAIFFLPDVSDVALGKRVTPLAWSSWIGVRATGQGQHREPIADFSCGMGDVVQYGYLKGGRGTMVTAEIRQVSDTTFIARGDTNHWVVMDDQTQFGGCEAASDPMEVLLFSLCGCMGMWLDVVIKKLSIPVERILIYIKGERAQEDPKVYTSICVACHFYGVALDHHKLEKVLSRVKEKHSAVYRMLERTVPIETHVKIHERGTDGGQ